MTPETHISASAPFTVLLVDDDSFIIDIYTVRFADHGHTAVPCLGGEEALKKLRAGFVPDIIVTDLIMPYIDGFDFIRTIREEKLVPNVPVVVLSNQDDFVDIEKTKQLNVTAHYIKIRSTPSETVTLIENVMNHVRSPDKYPALPVQ